MVIISITLRADVLLYVYSIGYSLRLFVICACGKLHLAELTLEMQKYIELPTSLGADFSKSILLPLSAIFYADEC